MNAKNVLVVFLIAVTVLLAEVESCSVDSDCSSSQCCMPYAGFIKLCVKKSNELTEACGGKFRCPECEPPFKCFLHERTISNYFKIGTGRCLLDRK